MKKIAFLSLSLVALSGGAGLGLSALHEFNMDVQTSALAAPDALPADSGFVIPDYVPNAGQFSAFAPELVAPEMANEPVVPSAVTASLGDITVVPAQQETTPMAPAVRESFAEVAKSVAKIRPAERPILRRTEARYAPATAAPAQSFAHTQDSTPLKYVIGVYR